MTTSEHVRPGDSRPDGPGPDLRTPAASRGSRPVPELEVDHPSGEAPPGPGVPAGAAGGGPDVVLNGSGTNGAVRHGHGGSPATHRGANPNGAVARGVEMVVGAPAPRSGRGHRSRARGGRFTTLAENAFDVVAVVSAEGRFTYVSPSAERIFGVPVGRAIGSDAFALFDAMSVEPVRAIFNDLVAGRRLEAFLELRTRRPDGAEVDLEVVATNHLDDPYRGIVVNIRDVTELRRLERQLRDSDRLQSVVVESLADGLLLVDRSGIVQQVNEAFEILLRAPRTRIVGLDLDEVVAGLTSQVVDEWGEPLAAGDLPPARCLATGRRQVGTVVGLVEEDGRTSWLRVSAQPLTDGAGRVSGAVATFSDVTPLREATRELRREEQFLQVLLDTLDEGIVACDAGGRLTVFNPAARRLHGFAADEAVPGDAAADLGLVDAEGAPLDARQTPLMRALAGERLRDVEVLLETRAGEHRKVSVNAQALVDEHGDRLGAVVAMHDVTEQKRNEERLAELAMHDPLTGLANRTLLALRLQEVIDGLRAAREDDDRHPGVAVYLLDLDDFKEINDALGHDVGDDLLVAVARRLAAIVRPSDTVARLGGDEFVVVCAIESGEEEMVHIAERIATALARPYRIDGRTLTAAASVGGVFADNPDTDPSTLLSRADDAMYGVKWSRRRDRRSRTT